MLGLSEIRAAALKGAKFDYDREVEGVRALDRYTLRIKLGEPGPRFHHYLANSSFLGAVAREVDEMYDENQMMANPVGTGPYRLVDWRRSSRMVLEKNPGYREDFYAEQPTDEYGAEAAARMKGRKLPLIDRVEVYIIEENQPRWLAFLNAEHDLVDEIPYDMANLIVPNGKLAPNLVKRGIRMDRDYRASVDMALFNMEHPLVGGYTPDKVALRRADRTRLLDRCRTRSGSCAKGSRFHRSRRCRPLLTATTPLQERNERTQPGAGEGATGFVSGTSIAMATAGASYLTVRR